MKRTFSPEFKLQVARQAYTGEKRVAQLCREHSLCQSLVTRWRKQYALLREHAFTTYSAVRPAEPEVPSDEARIAELEAALGRAHLEIELLRRTLKQAEKGGLLPGRNGK